MEAHLERVADIMFYLAELSFAKVVGTAVIPDLDDNRNALIIGIYTTLLILTVVSVVLRIASRRVSRAKLWWDDYCIIVALVEKLVNVALH